MSPDGGFSFAIDKDGVIRIWNTGKRAVVTHPSRPMPRIRNAVLSFGGKYIAVSVERAISCIFTDCAMGLNAICGHFDFVSGLSVFTGWWKRLATGSVDGTIRLWMWPRRDRPCAALTGHMEEASDVAFRLMARRGLGRAQ